MPSPRAPPSPPPPPTGTADVLEEAVKAKTDEMALATRLDPKEKPEHCSVCSHAPLGAGINRRTQLEADGDFPPGPPVGARSIVHCYDNDRGLESPTKDLVTEVGCAHLTGVASADATEVSVVDTGKAPAKPMTTALAVSEGGSVSWDCLGRGRHRTSVRSTGLPQEGRGGSPHAPLTVSFF